MMKYVQGEKLETLAKNHRLDGALVIWGIGEPFYQEFHNFQRFSRTFGFWPSKSIYASIL